MKAPRKIKPDQNLFEIIEINNCERILTGVDNIFVVQGLWPTLKYKLLTAGRQLNTSWLRKNRKNQWQEVGINILLGLF